MKPKLLLYCTKAKPYLYKTDDTMIEKMNGDYHTQLNKSVLNDNCLNGKIVAECDFDVEEIIYSKDHNDWKWYSTNSLYESQLCVYSCLSVDELENYLGDNGGYAIRIKNLNIFDKPREFSKCYYLTLEKGFLRQIKKAPQNMCNAYDVYKNHYILISIQPQWLCKILNGEKTIEVRKKVLKEMLE